MDVVEKIECLICGCSKFTHFPDGDKNLNLLPPLKVVRCISCGLLFMNPRPSSSARTDIFAGNKPVGLESYLENLANYGAVTKSREALFVSRVNVIKTKYFPQEPIDVLDVGSSSGEFMEAARSIGWQVVGVEPSAEGVRKAREKGLDVVQSAAEMLPFEDRSFDLVHSNHVFEHLADPLSAAKEIFRVLRPGGIMFIEVPNQFDNIQFLRYRLMRRIPVRKRGIRSIHHLVFFSRRALFRLMKEAGFENIKVSNKFGKSRNGLSFLGSLSVRLIGRFYLGAPIIQAVARKER